MIEIRELSYSSEEKTLLTDITVSFQDAEICAIIGASGSGKSLLLKLIAGDIRNYNGTISFSKPEDNNTKYQVTLFPGNIEINDSDHLINAVIAARVPFKKFTAPLSSLDRQIAEKYCSLLGIETFAGAVLETLPDSYYKKALLAHVFTRETPVLLLDNPDESLDPASKNQLERTIKSFTAAGHTVIFATHDLNFAARTADRIIVMNNGAIDIHGDMSIITEDMIRKNFAIEAIVSKNIYNGKPEVSIIPQT